MLIAGPATLIFSLLLAVSAPSAQANSHSDATQLDWASQRAQGQAGLDALIAANRELVERVRLEGVGCLTPAEAERWPALHAEISALAGQWDAHAAGLFWYTDSEAAQKEAARTGKPILSLRLLGQLTDEYSCANSRFFRTLLYPDPEVRSFLREHFVLHWSSERPVPRITIDMGDGRQLAGTLTGNSIHYVLDAQGRPLSAIPGLLHPQAFLEELVAAEQLHGLVCADPARFEQLLKAFHAPRALLAATPAATGPGDGSPPPSAREALPLALTKAFLEVPLAPMPVSAFEASDALTPFQRGQVEWELQRLRFLPPVLALIRDKSQIALAAIAQAGGPAPEIGLELRLAGLRESLALDTVQNRQVLGPRISARLAEGPTSFEDLNRWVYSELFLTPASDPWLGLISAGVYSGLPADGIRQPAPF